MDRALWNRLVSPRQTGARRTTRRVSRTKLAPGLEALDGRQLLSTVMPGAAAVLPTPPATAVSNAAAILGARDPATFAEFQTDLGRAEGHSHVSPAQASALAGDEAALDGLVESAGLAASAATGELNHVQDAVDEAFHPTLDRAETWAKDQRNLESYLSNVPGSTPLIRATIKQVHVVARATRISGPFQRFLSRDEQTLTADLGPTPNTDLGPGAVDRDPLEVYYDGQVNGFVK